MPTVTRKDILNELHRYLTGYGYHLAGEVYVLIDFCEDPKLWICSIDSDGSGTTLKFEEMMVGQGFD
jgi:hypothetical protein